MLTLTGVNALAAWIHPLLGVRTRIQMPPKLTSDAIDMMLEELRTFVRHHASAIASRAGTTLLNSLRQNVSAEEKKWYQFLVKKRAAFDQQQREHLNETFNLIESHVDSSSRPEPSPTDHNASDMDGTRGASQEPRDFVAPLRDKITT